MSLFTVGGTQVQTQNVINTQPDNKVAYFLIDQEDASTYIGFTSTVRAAELNASKNTTVTGHEAARLVQGDLNTAYGAFTLTNTTVGTGNVAIGAYAGQGNIVGSRSTYLGTYAGQKTLGSRNLFAGFRAGADVITGNSLIALGYGAQSTTSAANAANSIIIGNGNDGDAVSYAEGEFNIVLGNTSKVTQNSSNGIVIGHNSATTKSDSLVMGNNVTNYGSNVFLVQTSIPFDSNYVNRESDIININDKFIMGTSSTNSRIEIKGDNVGIKMESNQVLMYGPTISLSNESGYLAIGPSNVVLNATNEATLSSGSNAFVTLYPDGDASLSAACNVFIDGGQTVTLASKDNYIIVDNSQGIEVGGVITAQNGAYIKGESYLSNVYASNLFVQVAVDGPGMSNFFESKIEEFQYSPDFSNWVVDFIKSNGLGGGGGVVTLSNLHNSNYVCPALEDPFQVEFNNSVVVRSNLHVSGVACIEKMQVGDLIFDENSILRVNDLVVNGTAYFNNRAIFNYDVGGIGMTTFVRRMIARFGGANGAATWGNSNYIAVNELDVIDNATFSNIYIDGEILGPSMSNFVDTYIQEYFKSDSNILNAVGGVANLFLTTSFSNYFSNINPYVDDYLNAYFLSNIDVGESTLTSVIDFYLKNNLQLYSNAALNQPLLDQYLSLNASNYVSKLDINALSNYISLNSSNFVLNEIALSNYLAINLSNYQVQGGLDEEQLRDFLSLNFSNYESLNQSALSNYLAINLSNYDTAGLNQNSLSNYLAANLSNFPDYTLLNESALSNWLASSLSNYVDIPGLVDISTSNFLFVNLSNYPSIVGFNEHTLSNYLTFNLSNYDVGLNIDELDAFLRSNLSNYGVGFDSNASSNYLDSNAFKTLFNSEIDLYTKSPEFSNIILDFIRHNSHSNSNLDFSYVHPCPAELDVNSVFIDNSLFINNHLHVGGHACINDLYVNNLLGSNVNFGGAASIENAKINGSLAFTPSNAPSNLYDDWWYMFTDYNSNGIDLVFRSKRGTTVMFNDEFHPEVLNFTGKHRCAMQKEPQQRTLDKSIGMIAISAGRYENLQGEQIIEIDEAIPVIELCCNPKDKRVFGVIGGMEKEGKFRIGNMSFQHDGPKFTRVIVQSSGEGGIWVCNINGNLQNGDYITTSSFKGLGMRQDEDYNANFTVAKITCDCTFDLNSKVYKCVEFTQKNKIYRKAFVGCIYCC